MSRDDLMRHFINLVEKGEVEKVVKHVDILLQNDYTVNQIINDGLVWALDLVGQKMDEGEYFLPDLVVSGEAARVVLEKLKPHFEKEDLTRGTVVMGTVYGDVHDIGLNLVALTLEGSGFRVINLGVNTAVESFISAVKAHNADILAMSSLLTTTMSYMGNVTDALAETGLRDKVKVLVGGAPLSEEFAQIIGADAYGATARDAVHRANELLNMKALEG